MNARRRLARPAIAFGGVGAVKVRSLAGCLRTWRQCLAATETLPATLRDVGRALWTATAVPVSGFPVLALSESRVGAVVRPAARDHAGVRVGGGFAASSIPSDDQRPAATARCPPSRQKEAPPAMQRMVSTADQFEMLVEWRGEILCLRCAGCLGAEEVVRFRQQAASAIGEVGHLPEAVVLDCGALDYISGLAWAPCPAARPHVAHVPPATAARRATASAVRPLQPNRLSRLAHDTPKHGRCSWLHRGRLGCTVTPPRIGPARSGGEADAIGHRGQGRRGTYGETWRPVGPVRPGSAIRAGRMGRPGGNAGPIYTEILPIYRKSVHLLYTNSGKYRWSRAERRLQAGRLVSRGDLRRGPLAGEANARTASDQEPCCVRRPARACGTFLPCG